MSGGNGNVVLSMTLLSRFLAFEAQAGLKLNVVVLRRPLSDVHESGIDQQLSHSFPVVSKVMDVARKAITPENAPEPIRVSSQVLPYVSVEIGKFDHQNTAGDQHAKPLGKCSFDHWATQVLNDVVVLDALDCIVPRWERRYVAYVIYVRAVVVIDIDKAFERPLTASEVEANRLFRTTQ